MGPTRLSTWQRHSHSTMGMKGAFVILLMLIEYTMGVEHAYIEDAERFPGWKGELPNSFHVTAEDSVGYKEGGHVCVFI